MLFLNNFSCILFLLVKKNMKKRKIIATLLFALVITVTFSSAKTINLNKKTNEKNSDLEILDMKYEDSEMIASLYANVSFRTVHVYFYKAKIIGEHTTNPVLHGIVPVRTEKGKISNVSIPFNKKGSYQITVEILGYDKLSEEIYIPISVEEDVDLRCLCGECYSFGIFGKELRLLFFFVYNYGSDIAKAPFTTDIYIDDEKVTTKTHYFGISPNKYGYGILCFVLFSHHGISNDITVHVDGTNKFDETNEDNNWDSYGGRGKKLIIF